MKTLTLPNGKSYKLEDDGDIVAAIGKGHVVAGGVPYAFTSWKGDQPTGLREVKKAPKGTPEAILVLEEPIINDDHKATPERVPGPFAAASKEELKAAYLAIEADMTALQQKRKEICREIGIRTINAAPWALNDGPSEDYPNGSALKGKMSGNGRGGSPSEPTVQRVAILNYT